MHDKEISRRSFVQVSMAGCLAALATGASPAAETMAQVARKRLTVSNSASIRILQFTDVHFFNGVAKAPEEEKENAAGRRRTCVVLWITRNRTWSW